MRARAGSAPRLLAVRQNNGQITLKMAVGCTCRCRDRGTRQDATTRRATARKEEQRRLARRMVALSGLSVRDEAHPDADIAIVFTGLRPGEKLYEELLIGDNPLPTAHPRILRAREEHLTWDELIPLLTSLHDAAHNDNLSAMKELLTYLVPGYYLQTNAIYDAPANNPV
ncbi:MAG: polysaccharide biosynthesis protein [Comamonadaceae bacterium]|nr:polysaccharide biosynthesis protein [Comamonadaceae bacterium]